MVWFGKKETVMEEWAWAMDKGKGFLSIYRTLLAAQNGQESQYTLYPT